MSKILNCAYRIRYYFCSKIAGKKEKVKLRCVVEINTKAVYTH